MLIKMIPTDNDRQNDDFDSRHKGVAVEDISDDLDIHEVVELFKCVLDGWGFAESTVDRVVVLDKDEA